MKKRLLTPLKEYRSEKPLKFATFDIETNNWTEIKLIGFYDGRDYYTFKTIDEFLKFLNASGKYRYFKIYAHNGGKFDFLPIIDELAKQKISYRLTPIGPRIAEIKIHEFHYSFRDSICLLPYSLKQLTHDFKTTHAKGEIDHVNDPFNPENPLHLEYLKNDTIGLYEVIEKFYSIPIIKRVRPKLTSSSTALAIHRTMLTHSIEVTSQKTQDFVRKSYVGGRCEIFKREGKNLEYYDINSLYPYCMSSKPLPLEFLYKTTDPLEFGFHDVTVEVPSVFIPVLPVRANDKLIFPTGRFRGVYFSEELKLAVIQGCRIIEHHEGHAFSETKHFFSDYVFELYNIRKSSGDNKALNLTAKLLMNGLYGKYGQREEFQTLVTKDLADFDEEGRFPDMFGDTAELQEKFNLCIEKVKRRQNFMLVHIAAAVTSWGRIHLYEKGLKTGDPLYCDTDSIFTPHQFPTSLELGDFKHEMSIKRAYFRLPKLYYLETKEKPTIKAKGFPKIKSTKTIEQFKNTNLFNELERPMGFKASIKKNGIAFSKNVFKKSIKSDYTKRVVLPNGINTRPLEYINGVLR